MPFAFAEQALICPIKPFESSNLLDAATRGAVEGANLVLQITAIVVAFIASVAFLNTMVSFFGGLGSILATS